MKEKVVHENAMKVLVKEFEGHLAIKEIGEVSKTGSVPARRIVPACYDVEQNEIVKIMDFDDYIRFTRMSNAATRFLNASTGMSESDYQYALEEIEKNDASMDLVDFMEKKAEIIEAIAAGTYKKEPLKPAKIDWIIGDKAKNIGRHTTQMLNTDIEFLLDNYDCMAREEKPQMIKYYAIEIIRLLMEIETLLIHYGIGTENDFVKYIVSEMAFLHVAVPCDGVKKGFYNKKVVL